VEIPRKRDIVKQSKTPWSRQVLDLAEPQDKPLCHLCVDLFVVIVFC
jgi:hypothetical protein